MPDTIRNPAYDLDSDAIASELRRMTDSPIVLRRPVVILGGWHAPRISAMSIERIVRPLTSGREEDFLAVTFPWSTSIERAVAKARRAIARRWGPSSEFDWRGVDLIGASMGGLIARALCAGVGGRPLRAGRVFTLATPHRGARFARLAAPDRAARQMKPNSSFLSGLDASLREGSTELVCYALLRDWLVGATNTAPPGRDPIWLDVPRGPARSLSHFMINRDRRILLDVARRLRAEPPLARASAPPRD